MMNGNAEQDYTHTLSILVANKPGVLARIAQIFARRGYNIDSLVVSPADDGRYSRMTIAAKGSPEGLEQIILQLDKLVDVMHCQDLACEAAVVRELALLKLHVDSKSRTSALQVCEHFGGKTVDLTHTSMIVMVTGPSDKIDAAVRMFDEFKVVEMIRTGKVVMARGEKVT